MNLLYKLEYLIEISTNDWQKLCILYDKQKSNKNFQKQQQNHKTKQTCKNIMKVPLANLWDSFRVLNLQEIERYDSFIIE